MSIFDRLKQSAVDAAATAATAIGNKRETFTFAARPESLAQLQALPEAVLDTPFQTAALTVLALRSRAPGLRRSLWVLLAASAGLLLFLLLLVIILLIRRRRRKKVDERKKQELDDMLVAAGFVPDVAAPAGADVMSLQTEKSMELRKDIRQFANDNPEIAAQMVRGWLRGGEMNG